MNQIRWYGIRFLFEMAGLLDHTNCFETVPANQLETALWLESDRMGFLLDSLDRTTRTGKRAEEI